jgi:putative membrane protein
VNWAKIFFWILIFIFAILFSIQNRDEVIVRFVFLPVENYHWAEIPSVPLPLFLVILGSLFLGVLIGGLFDLYKRLQLRKRLRLNKERLEKLERENQLLRSPILDQPSFLKKVD